MFNPIPLFSHIQPADFLKAINDLIVKINNNFQAAGFGYSGSVTLKQFKLALAQTNSNHTVMLGLPASPDNAAFIQWTSGGTVTPNDPLATEAQAALGFTSAQMAALFALAEAMTP